MTGVQDLPFVAKKTSQTGVIWHILWTISLKKVLRCKIIRSNLRNVSYFLQIYFYYLSRVVQADDWRTPPPTDHMQTKNKWNELSIWFVNVINENMISLIWRRIFPCGRCKKKEKTKKRNAMSIVNNINFELFKHNWRLQKILDKRGEYFEATTPWAGRTAGPWGTRSDKAFTETRGLARLGVALWVRDITWVRDMCRTLLLNATHGTVLACKLPPPRVQPYQVFPWHPTGWREMKTAHIKISEQTFSKLNLDPY